MMKSLKDLQSDEKINETKIKKEKTDGGKIDGEKTEDSANDNK